MAYWIVKSEPGSYGWDDLVRDRTTEWDGVRNHAAAGHLRAMAKGDGVLFYHSGEARAVVGIAHVVRTARPDGPADQKWVSVELAADRPLPRAVTLAELKADPALADLAMVRQSRLSVSPATAAEWQAIRALAGTPR